jgi:hypothetical protein
MPELVSSLLSIALVLTVYARRLEVFASLAAVAQLRFVLRITIVSLAVAPILALLTILRKEVLPQNSNAFLENLVAASDVAGLSLIASLLVLNAIPIRLPAISLELDL